MERNRYEILTSHLTVTTVMGNVKSDVASAIRKELYSVKIKDMHNAFKNNYKFSL